MEESPEQATVSWSSEVCLIVKGQLMRDKLFWSLQWHGGLAEQVLSAQGLNPRVLILPPLLSTAHKPLWDCHSVPDMLQCWLLSCPYPKLCEHLPIRGSKVDTCVFCGSDSFLWGFKSHSTHANKIKMWCGLYLTLVCNSARTRTGEASACSQSR